MHVIPHATQTAKPEAQAAPTEAQAPAANEESLSPRFLALAKQEKLIRAERQAIAAEKAKFEAEKKAREEEYAQKYIPKERLKTDFWSVATESGLSVDEILQMSMNAPAPVDPTLLKLQQEVESLRKEKEQEKVSQTEAQTKAYEQAVAKLEADTIALVSKDERFDTVKSAGAEKAVVELIKQKFEEDPTTVLSVEEAAQMIEDHLVEEGLKFAGFNKIKAKLNPIPAEQTPATLKQSHTPKLTTTITNAGTASTSSRPLSPREKRERAIAAFKGQLT
jgi:hypothetical protein